MRKNSMPQVETREISDGDLDNVSGGMLGVDSLAQTAESLLPASTVSGGAGIQINGPVSVQAGISGLAGI